MKGQFKRRGARRRRAQAGMRKGEEEGRRPRSGHQQRARAPAGRVGYLRARSDGMGRRRGAARVERRGGVPAGRGADRAASVCVSLALFSPRRLRRRRRVRGRSQPAADRGVGRRLHHARVVARLARSVRPACAAPRAPSRALRVMRSSLARRARPPPSRRAAAQSALPARRRCRRRRRGAAGGSGSGAGGGVRGRLTGRGRAGLMLGGARRHGRRRVRPRARALARRAP